LQTLNEIRDGIHPNTSRADYESIQAVNYSLLKHFARSPAHAREYMLHPLEPTPAMDEGTALHCAILEPKRFATDYVVAPQCDRRTTAGKNAWKEFEEENHGKAYLSADDAEGVKAMTDSAFANETVSNLLSSPGRQEVAVVWTDKQTGLRCKALIDRVTHFAGWTVIVDLKKCRDAAPWSFGAQVARLAYHEQAAYYLDGLSALAAANRRFFWVAIEDERPYAVAVYEATDEILDQGRLLYREHLAAYKQCVESNVWPGYPNGVQPLRLPRWAFAGGINDGTN
jgi:PDDEXK-like domain of unknown function (DUF3799)